MDSIWTEIVRKPEFKSLKSDMKTDVLIIGGGITGLLCAYMLETNGIDYLLVEQGKICNGITKNTTAKITTQHGLIYDKIIKIYGIEAAQKYFVVNNNALQEYRKICEKIECDFTQLDSYLYSTKDRIKIEKEICALEKIGVSAKFINELPLPFSVVGAVMMNGQAQFHPLKFLYNIAENLNVLENTKVKELLPNTAVTDCGKIKAQKIIVTTHFPFINKHGAYFLKMYQHRSYVLALKNAAKYDGIYVDEAQQGMSFRNFNDTLILGGEGHRTGKSSGNWDELRRFADKYYSESKEVGFWATQDCLTLDGIPYIGQYSKHTENLLVATGFNKWGMTSSMVAAMILKDMILGKKNEFASLFSPDRKMLRPQLVKNVGHAMFGLLNPTVPRCPHMGCALKYNKNEHSWDCSCHGSRFTEDGKLIDNPATDDKDEMPEPE